MSAADDGTAVHAGFLSMRAGADALQAGDERTSGLDEPAWSGVRYVPRVPRRLMASAGGLSSPTPATVTTPPPTSTSIAKSTALTYSASPQRLGQRPTPRHPTIHVPAEPHQSVTAPLQQRTHNHQTWPSPHFAGLCFTPSRPSCKARIQAPRRAVSASSPGSAACASDPPGRTRAIRTLGNRGPWH